MVGDMAESVSSRKLEPLPNVLVCACAILRESFGRPGLDGDERSSCCEWRAGLSTREAAILSDGIS